MYGSTVTLEELWVSGGRALLGGGIGIVQSQAELVGLRVTGNGIRYDADVWAAGGGDGGGGRGLMLRFVVCVTQECMCSLCRGWG